MRNKSFTVVPRKPKNTDKTSSSASDAASMAEAKTPRRTRSGAKKSGASAKKTRAGGGEKQPRAPRIGAMVDPTDEDIRMRAYFIAERRQRLALPGDSSSDWLEAKRQLLSEGGRR
jgi:hypothetical protein